MCDMVLLYRHIRLKNKLLLIKLFRNDEHKDFFSMSIGDNQHDFLEPAGSEQFPGLPWP